MKEVNAVNYVEARLGLGSGVVMEGWIGSSGRPIESTLDRFAYSLAEEIAGARRPIGTLSPLYRGSRFNAILDGEASGALAAAIADYIMAGRLGSDAASDLLPP